MNDYLKIYEEYCKELQAEEIEKSKQENFAKHRKEYLQHTIDSGRHFVNDQNKGYMQKFETFALQKNKSKQEWQNEDNFNPNTERGVIKHISASEAYDKANKKLQNMYQTELFYTKEIETCETKLKEFFTLPESKRKTNKITHWENRLHDFRRCLYDLCKKMDVLENRCVKWTGVLSSIRTAEINKQIKSEKIGIGNKYGFNPNMQDRATATDIFSDFEY